MGKKNRKQQNVQQGQGRPAATSQPSPTGLAAKLEAALVANAESAAEIPEEVLASEVQDESPGVAATPATAGPAEAPVEPGQVLADLHKLQKAWEKALEEANRNNDRAKKWNAQAKTTEEAWSEKTRLLAEEERDLKGRKESLASEELVMQQRREDLIKLQADAEAGFISRRSELLADLEAEIRKYSGRFLEHDRKLHEEFEAAEEALDRKRAAISEECQREKDSIQELRRQAEAEARKAKWLSEELEAEKSDWKKRVEEQIARGISDYVAEMEGLRITIEQQRTKLRDMEAAQKTVGNRSASELARKIEDHEKTIESLNARLAAAPGIDERDRVRQLQSENDHLQLELGRLQQENAVLHRQAGRASIGIAELENLRDQRAAWECRELGYRARLEELRSDIEEYTAKVNDKDVFPACSDMDRDAALQKPPVIRSIKEISLKEFASEVRQLIGSTGLFYRPEDIRSFIAGLASSRLHILQGISGTGKTSLPLAFAKVMHWGSDLCEVQSGWRDRNDLLGYFNTFEKKFYESDFLKALYKAGSPAYSELPFFIVLDEMNLSHPEHYFADFLSVLEKRTAEKTVSLPNAPLADNGPACLTDKGRRIPLPPNVWFIGTANQDETTKDFADKTYDRSHIMEFPRHREQFKATPPNIPPGRISFEHMKGAFEGAVAQHAARAEECIRILDNRFREPLEDMEIGWGNRLETQLRSYIPVLVASGGDLSEGLDSILSRKLLRKLKGRFDLSSEDMLRLQNTITSVWEDEAQLKAGIPKQSVGLIQGELRRLGGS